MPAQYRSRGRPRGRARGPTPLESAYDDACAVFTRPFTFWEWKAYAVPSADSAKWAPLGVSKNKSTAYREITHDVWIYVFRKYEGLESNPPVWVEELFHAKDGTISAAPIAEQLAHLSSNPKVEPKERPDKKPIGRTTTFPRRINGRRTVHFLFASRVRLPLPLVNTLMTGAVGAKVVKARRIDEWAPAYSFEKDDNNVLVKDGKLIVAVVDPITIALHLHTYAEAAAQDCMDYGGEQSDKFAGRQCKVMLAQILQSLLAADKELYQDVYADEDKDKKTWDPYAVDRFLDEYHHQIGYRRRWRIRWHTFLVNWLDSEPFHIALEAYWGVLPVEALVLICRLLRRISDSGIGRLLLLQISDGQPKKNIDDKWGWVSQHIFPTEGEPELSWEIIKKAGVATIGAVKEWAPFVSTGLIKPTYIIQAINHPLAVRLGVKPATQIIAVGKGSVPGFMQSWSRGRTDYVMYEIDPGEKAKLKANWGVGLAWAEMALQVINAAVAAKTIVDAFGEKGNKEKKAMAVILGVHAIAHVGAVTKEIQKSYKEYAAELANDTSKETAEAIEHYEIAAGRLAAIAAIADFVIGVDETFHSFEEGEKGEGVGHLISTMGYGVEFVGAVGIAGGIPALGELIMIGAALVMIGDTIIKFFKKSDYQHFLRHCFWGTEYGESGPEREWAVAPFKQWKGRYDLQLKSLIQLICKFEIDEDLWSGLKRVKIPSDLHAIRTVKVKLGWLPISARIDATYVEQWQGTGTQNLHGSWEVTDQNSVTKEYNIEAKKDNTLKIELKEGELKVSQLGTSARADLVHKYAGAKFSYNRWHRDFQQLKVGMRLVLTLGNEEVTIPYEENTFKEVVVAKNDNSWAEN
jgi:hypothetical protein